MEVAEITEGWAVAVGALHEGYGSQIVEPYRGSISGVSRRALSGCFIGVYPVAKRPAHPPPPAMYTFCWASIAEMALLHQT